MLTIRWQVVSGMQRLGNAMGRLSDHQLHLALQRAVNHTGDKARTRVQRALAKQTGLGYGVIKRAIRVGRAWGAGTNAAGFKAGRGSLDYVMSTKGGDISLKYFKARETRAGVTAAPFGQRKLFPGTFMKGGKFPERNRMHTVLTKGEAALHGHVWKRIGKARTPLELQNSGVVIPEQMLIGETSDAFRTVVDDDLPKRVMHEINRLAPDIFT